MLLELDFKKEVWKVLVLIFLYLVLSNKLKMKRLFTKITQIAI